MLDGQKTTGETDFNFAEFEKIYNKLINQIYENETKEDTILKDFETEFKNLLNLTANILNKGVEVGFGKINTQQDEIVIENLKNNVYIFSGFKTYETLKKATELLLDENDNIKNFDKFKKDIQTLNKNYNDFYLRSEYNHAIGSAQMASIWQNITENQDDYDLQYDAVNDQRTRLTHLQLDGIIKPANDAFWNTYYPPNAWNCRCTVRLVPKGTKSKPMPEDFAGINEMFRGNTAKDGVIFPKKHAYYQQNEDVKAAIEKAMRYKTLNENEVFKTYMQKIENSNLQQEYKNLDIEELASIKYYTSIHYQNLNDRLRRGKASPFQKNIETTINKGLEKLPKHTKTTYRFDSTMLANNHLQKIEELFEKNLPYIDKGFFSSSETSNLRKKLLSTNTRKYCAIIDIESKNGVKIADISEKPEQDEVLFKSNTAFKITTHEAREGYIQITLKEI